MTNSPSLKNKTLIISSWAPPMVGGPQNLYNLFSAISGPFAIITSRQMLDESKSRNVMGSWLPCRYYAFEGGQIDQAMVETVAIAQQNPVVTFIKKIPLIGWHVAAFGRSISSFLRAIRSTRNVITTEDVKMLFGISDTGLSLITTWITSRLTGTPYCLYLFDLYKGNLLTPPYSWLARWLERPIMTQARTVILTNTVTEDFYKKRYGLKIQTAVVHNSIFDRHTVNDYDPQPPYTIVFTGNVYWAQEQAVMNLIAAMEKLSDLPLTLKLFVPKPPDSLKTAVIGKSNIELGAASQDEMPVIQSAATLLYLPLAWNTKAPDIIATATPGKFTDYLDSGRPMLVHAPDYAYVSSYTKGHRLGLVVDTNSVDALAVAIRNFLANPKQGKTYIDNALKVFAANHEAKKNAAKLTELLNLIN